MSFLSMFRKEKEEFSLLVDISDSSISASLVLFSLDNIPKFIYNSGVEFGLEKLDASHLVMDLEHLLDEALKTVTKKGFEAITAEKERKLAHVMISFSSPW